MEGLEHEKIILICIMILLSVIPGFSYFVELEYVLGAGCKSCGESIHVSC